MSGSQNKPRVAVLSPFLDKKHGTERCMVEWISRLTDEFEIHLYSQRVEDLDLSEITWHKIPALPGPHLFNYLFWFAANHVVRFWDRRFRGIEYDLVFSPGINCLDAEVMSVHIVFAQYVSKIRGSLRLGVNRVKDWPVVMHRRMYYRLIMWLEERLYTNTGIPLVFIAQRTAREMARFYGARSEAPILYPGRDSRIFNSRRRLKLRAEARAQLDIADTEFALILVGNDWRNKGVPAVLEALAQVRDLPIVFLLVSREDPAPVRELAKVHGVEERIRYLAPRAEVDVYYAAADAYVGPSLEDTFAFPPAEAMACGLPAIVSAENGTAEIISHETDGLILDEPRDVKTLAKFVRRLYDSPEWRTELGRNAERTASQYTWERNSSDLALVFRELLRRKGYGATQSVPLDI